MSERLDEIKEKPSGTKIIIISLLVIAWSGPWAILGTIITQLLDSSILAMFVIGPLIEEIFKASGVLWLVEKKPKYILGRWHGAILGASAGLIFATVENFIYLYYYFPENSFTGDWHNFALYRWTVCVFLHITASAIMGYGLAKLPEMSKIKKEKFKNDPFMDEDTRLDIDKVLPWVFGSIGLHAFYNITVFTLEKFDVLSF